MIDRKKEKKGRKLERKKEERISEREGRIGGITIKMSEKEET